MKARGGVLPTNSAHLEVNDEQLVRPEMLAERYVAEDPNTSLSKLRQLTELLAQLVATKVGEYSSREEAQHDLLRQLQDHGILLRESAQLFTEILHAGNAANHTIAGDHWAALSNLKITWQLSIWFHRTFANPSFKSGPFVPPPAPQKDSDELKAELAGLAKKLAKHQSAYYEVTARLASTKANLRDAKEEQAFWEEMALEAEQAKVAIEQKLVTAQAQGFTRSKRSVTALVTAAARAAGVVELDEVETRKIIDEQLRQVGWMVDSTRFSYAKGVRPEKGKIPAIAEWSTLKGCADYVFFDRLIPMAAVEAQRKKVDVSSAPQLAKRYSRASQSENGHLSPSGTWDEYSIPFVFSSNLGEIIDGKEPGIRPLTYISELEDSLIGTVRGCGKATKQEAHLKDFSEVVRFHSNTFRALLTVITRPRELMRKEFRELTLELDRAESWGETHLSTAWREMTNQDIDARIFGYIRQAGIGDALIPYGQRMALALQARLSAKPWAPQQRRWLQKIAAQTKANIIVDRAALDDPDSIFRREGGRFLRLDRNFGGELPQVLTTFNDSLWPPAA